MLLQHRSTVSMIALVAAAVFTAGAASAVPPDAPGELSLEPLRVSPRKDPGRQLLRLRFEDPQPVATFQVEVRVPGRPPESVASGQPDEVLGGFSVLVPPLDEETSVTVRAAAEEWSREASIDLGPLRPWKLFLVQHTHTDIGYTALPSRLNADHLVFIDEAVRACRLTDSHPDDARFRWTCEATWSVERYLEDRPPEAIDEFLGRVREGRIEVTAMRMNMTDLASEELVVRNLLPVQRLRDRGIEISTAMQCDVNGYPWMLPELFEEIGVRGLAGGINQTRSTLPFAFPRAISWQSPGGRQVVAWRGEHYMFANFMGFRDSLSHVLDRLPGYLRMLEKRGYPYSIALLQMAGYFTDNAAPSHAVSDLVRDWNERFATPRVRLATLSEWFDALETQEPGPVHRQAWPDWWADGVGSAPLETAIVRETQEDLSFAETFLSLGRAVHAGAPDRRRALHDAYLHASLYDEHTFGAAESIDRPGSVNTKSQWKEKSSNAYRARWLARELTDLALSVWAPGAVERDRSAIVVFNSMGWKRSSPVIAEIPRGVVDEPTPFRVVDAATGDEIPYQFRECPRNYREIEFVARSVPAVGYRVYGLEIGQEPADPASGFEIVENTISNGLTRIELDLERALGSIRHLPGGPNLVDGSRDYGFHQYVHEEIVHEKGRWHLWPAAESYSPEAFRRRPAKGVVIAPGEAGPARASLVLRSRVQRASGEIDVEVESEYSLYRGLPGVYIESRVETPGTTDPAAGYFSFSFAGREAPRADVAGGVMVPGRDQIPGSAADWHALQRWVRVGGGGADGDPAAVWVTRDVPLVQFGGFNTGRWTQGLRLEDPVFHSWAMNNYWFTNFVAAQRGEFFFRYAVAGGDAGRSDAGAHRFAREVCSPLVARVVDGRGKPGAAPSASFLAVSPACVDLIQVKEAEKASRSLVIRLRNRSGEPAAARLSFGEPLRPRRAVATDILENPRKVLEAGGAAIEVPVAPWKLSTVLVTF